MNYFVYSSLCLRIFLGQALRSQFVGPKDYTFNILKAIGKLPSEKNYTNSCFHQEYMNVSIFLSRCQYDYLLKKFLP